MSRNKHVSVVKTAQMADTLKLVVDGRVAGSVTEVDVGTVELRDANERLMGAYGDVATAIAAFERSIAVDETSLDL